MYVRTRYSASNESFCQVKAIPMLLPCGLFLLFIRAVNLNKVLTVLDFVRYILAVAIFSMTVLVSRDMYNKSHGKKHD